jgi:hypothetical protein
LKEQASAVLALLLESHITMRIKGNAKLQKNKHSLENTFQITAFKSINFVSGLEEEIEHIK